MFIRHFIFIVFAFALISCPLSLFLFTCFDGSTNESVLYEKAYYLSGGFMDSGLNSNLSLESYLAGDLQNSVEVEINNKMPFKGETLLVNAQLERTSIAIASIPFQWDCFPTYYSSSHIYIPSHDSISKIPAKRSKSYEDRLMHFVDGFIKNATRIQNEDSLSSFLK